MTLRNIRLVTAAALLVGSALLAACGGGASAPALPAGDQTGALNRVTAEWLAQQPGLTLGDYSFHLLDAANQPLPWRGLSVRQDGDDLTVESVGDPPADAYIYVVYPAERRAFAAAELVAERTNDYLIIASPGRTENVLPVGIARVRASRERRLAAGPLLRIRFAEGRERVFRRTSAVSDDPANAVTLVLGPAGAGTVQLSWEERNLGDYDNNGLVTIADLSPLGANFQQSVGADPKLVLIDGDENGELTIADIGKIGKNIGTALNGYRVKRTPTADFFIDRDDVLNATPVAQRKQRLQYDFDAPFVTATTNDYSVVPVGDDNSEGPESNIVTFDATGTGNQPPLWDSTEGITSVTPITGGLRLTFGSASDPEGGPVDYILKYNEAPKAPGAGDATTLQIPALNVAGSPPYTFDLLGLDPGVEYNLRLHAQDAQGLLSTNTAQQSGTVPTVALSSDPWSSPRANPLRNGSAAVTTGNAPFEVAWSRPVAAPYSLYLSEPLVRPDGEVVVLNDTGAPVSFSVDGDPFWTGAVGPGNGSFPASFGDTVCTAQTTLNVFTEPFTTFTPYDPGFVVSGSPLALGNYALLPGDDRHALQLLGGLVPDWTHQNVGEHYDNYLAACDGNSVFTISQGGLVEKKRDALSGAFINSRQLTLATDVQKGIMVDAQRNQLLFVPPFDALQVLDGDSLADKQVFDDFGEYSWYTWPCLALQASPPLAIMVTHANPLPNPGSLTVRAYDLETLTEAWATVIPNAVGSTYTCASADRIFVGDGNRVHILDTTGLMRQTVNLGAAIGFEVALTDDGFYAQTDTSVVRFGPAATNNPPVWQGTSAKPGGGIRDLTETGGDVTVEWDYATDELGQAVSYAIYWREILPPDFDSPGAETHVIDGIPDNGTGSHQFTFTPGTTQRIYVGVRAYDAPVGENPQFDSNTNWLAITPGWGREELVLGTELPAGEVFFMRGATRGDGSLAVVYNDEATTELTYVFGTTGAWSFEDTALNSFPTNGFDITETANGARMAICDDDAAALSRTGPNTWTRTAVQGLTEPELNPQISIARNGAAGALAYNQHISGAFPTPETHYWSSFLTAGQWQPAEEIDDQNFSGRDLGMTYCQGNPLVAYQLGLNYAPNRLTPQLGLLRMGRWNGSEWDLFILDPGLNEDDNPLTVESDCGKRIRVAANGNIIHMTWLDLNSSSTQPRGQLKYGVYDPVANTFDITVLSTFDLSMQPGSLQFTWGELGLALSGGEPVVSYLIRETGPSGTLPHYDSLWLWDHRGGGWNQTKLGDAELSFPSDREPCVLLRDGSNKLHVFFASSTKDFSDTPTADKLVHVYEK